MTYCVLILTNIKFSRLVAIQACLVIFLRDRTLQNNAHKIAVTQEISTRVMHVVWLMQSSDDTLYLATVAGLILYDRMIAVM